MTLVINLLSPKKRAGHLRVVRTEETHADDVRVIRTLEDAEQIWVREYGYPQVPLWMRAELSCGHRVTIAPRVLPPSTDKWDTGATSTPVEDIEKLLREKR